MSLESAPLLADSSSESSGYGTALANKAAFEGKPGKPREELWAIIKSSLPLIVTFFLQYSLSVTAIFSVGHIGKQELAAVSLAIMTFNVSCAVINGMATCLDTFCSQAYGAKRYDLVGMYFQRCTAMIFVVMIPIYFLWWNADAVLSLVVPEPELTALAQDYLTVISFGAPGYVLFETGKRFLQAQGIFVAGQYCMLIVAPINGLLNYLLVWDASLGIGFKGAPLATAISFWLLPILLLLYAKFFDGSACWYGLQIKESFTNWGPMLKLALNGTAMVLSEFIAFEVLTLAASRFGTTNLAAQSVVSSLASLMFQIPFGVAVAAATIIANHVGAGNMPAAITANKVTFYISSALGLFNASSLIVFRKHIPKLFTSDTKVVAVAAKILIILGINQLWDCANVLLAGCLRGQGRQHIGSALNLVAYYVVGVPLALIFAFHCGWGILGLWAGLCVGVCFLAVSEAYFVLIRSDWNAIYMEAKQRNSVSATH